MMIDSDTTTFLEVPVVGGLQASHYASCIMESMTEEEIAQDWAEVEKALFAMHEEMSDAR